MPRTYKRKTTRGSWTSETLQEALAAIENGRHLREVSRSFAIPRATLQDRRRNGRVAKVQLGRRPVFTQKQERELAEQIINLSKLFFGITPAQIQQSAYTFAQSNNLNNPFKEEKGSAGRDWLEGFLRRNPHISLRKPESTSVNRVTAFNKEEIGLFFANLSTLMDKYKFSPARIFNADETGITTVQRPNKIYAEKGQKRVGFLTSWERGKTTTVMCSFSASGIYVPPMFIYARKRMSDHLKKNGPPGAVYHCSDNGWITEDLFIDWLKHFEHCIKVSKEDPVLLLLDNHSSHCSLNAYNFCKEKGIIMLTIPPHTSHRVQPLDVTFYGPLKSAYNSECDKFMRSHPGEKITPYIVADLFNKAFGRVATIEKATKGFEVTGIFPVNPDVFNAEDFAPAENLKPANLTEPVPRNEQLEENRIDEKEVDIGAQMEVADTKENDSRQNLSFREILPIPGCSGTNDKGKKVGKKQHSEIFTSTPMKEMLEKKENAKQERLKKTNRALELAKIKGIKKQVFANFDDTSVLANKNTNNKQDKPKLKKKNLVSYHGCDKEEENSDAEVTEDICSICGEFGKNRELWLRCVNCAGWAHKQCTNGESKKTYVCDFCQ